MVKNKNINNNYGVLNRRCYFNIIKLNTILDTSLRIILIYYLNF